MRYDIIIRNGRVFDGLGGPSRVADIAIQAGKVARICESGLEAAQADREAARTRAEWIPRG